MVRVVMVWIVMVRFLLVRVVMVWFVMVWFVMVWFVMVRLVLVRKRLELNSERGSGLVVPWFRVKVTGGCRAATSDRVRPGLGFWRLQIPVR